ncbi:MAG: hypothetical protein R3B70_29460 [Polyangiaceae bacterium]
MQLAGWNLIDEKAGVLWREYSFSKGAKATTLVFRGAEGLVVVSPATGLEARDYDALKEIGEVRALIANNTFHHLGQLPWRAHFPEAVSYCPPRAVKALHKKVPSVAFQSMDALALPENVRYEDPPGFKTGEVVLSVGTARGSVWYTGDLLTNLQSIPKAPVGWLFSWTDSGPGYRLFRPGVWLFIKDKKAAREWALARVAKEPPAIVIPGHGPAIDAADVAEQTRVQLERL